MGFGSMKNFHSFICGVYIMSICQNMKVPPANERDLKRKCHDMVRQTILVDIGFIHGFFIGSGFIVPLFRGWRDIQHA